MFDNEKENEYDDEKYDDPFAEVKNKNDDIFENSGIKSEN